MKIKTDIVLENEDVETIEKMDKIVSELCHYMQASKDRNSCDVCPFEKICNTNDSIENAIKDIIEMIEEEHNYEN